MDEVLLHAIVIDDKQRMITTLDRNAFTVFEDGKPQKVTSFRHEDIPVAMGIVIDNSGSMREKRVKVNQAALNLVRASNPQDEVFVVNFSDEYYLDQPFTSDIKKLREALDKIDARGGTALYDAVVASAEELKKNARLDRKVLLVVTDGGRVRAALDLRFKQLVDTLAGGIIPVRPVPFKDQTLTFCLGQQWRLRQRVVRVSGNMLEQRHKVSAHAADSFRVE